MRINQKKIWKIVGLVLAGLLVFLICTLLIYRSEKINEKEEGVRGRVIEVIDGDTVVVDMQGGRMTVRLIGIDAPESVDPRKKVECFALQSSGKVRSDLVGQTVRLEGDKTQAEEDDYGRLLRYIFVGDGQNYNELLIKEGYAREYTFKGKKYIYRQEFLDAEESARKSLSGLWGECVDKR